MAAGHLLDFPCEVNCEDGGEVLRRYYWSGWLRYYWSGWLSQSPLDEDEDGGEDWDRALRVGIGGEEGWGWGWGCGWTWDGSEGWVVKPILVLY